jgi:hypothetical protein
MIKTIGNDQIKTEKNIIAQQAIDKMATDFFESFSPETQCLIVQTLKL